MIAEEQDALTVIAGVGAWARPFLRGDAPMFGTAEWLDLHVSDPRRTSAVVRAALAWWRVGEPLDELDVRARAAALVDASHAVAGAVSWRDLSNRPSRVELERRRAWSGRECRQVTVVDARRSWVLSPSGEGVA